MNINNLIEQFDLQGKVATAVPFGNGHINDTFHLCNHDAALPDYLLQRVNHLVFKPVAAMMENIRKVTEHVNEKAMGATLELIPTLEGKDFFKDEKGNYWRVFIFRKELLAYDIAETPEQIYEGAKAFGRFLDALSDFPAAELFPTIPNFHNVITRLAAFDLALKADVKGRAKESKKEIGYVLRIAQEMCMIQHAGEAGKIPLRVTHNDTKFNNVLLDHDGKGRCVIDLDTVMPGYVHFDFGDGVRTTVSTAAEDEADLEKIAVDLDRFSAFAQGYLEVTHATLSPLEIEYLPLSAAMLAYLMGLRFLTDYLAGDVYYKIHFEQQNFQRAKAQLDLCQKILERKKDLSQVIQGLVGVKSL